MGKELLKRIAWAEQILNNPQDADLDAAMEDLSRWIAYFQHERLIHLIVTALFALLGMMGLLLLMVHTSPATMALLGLFVLLLVFYIRHYYLLENGTQKLYGLMDKMKNQKRENPKASSISINKP